MEFAAYPMRPAQERRLAITRIEARRLVAAELALGPLCLALSVWITVHARHPRAGYWHFPGFAWWLFALVLLAGATVGIIGGGIRKRNGLQRKEAGQRWMWHVGVEAVARSGWRLQPLQALVKVSVIAFWAASVIVIVTPLTRLIP